MWLIVLAISLVVLTGGLLAALTLGKGDSARVNQRLEALDHEFAPSVFEEKTADIRRNQQKLSAIPLLNHWLTKMNLAPASALYLYQADVHSSLGALLFTSLGCSVTAGSFMYLHFRSVMPALLASAACLALPFLYVSRKRTKRLSRLEGQLPEALGMMSSALRVGHSFTASLGAVAQESPEPIGGEMRKCFDEQNFGVDLRTALVNLTRRAPIQDFRIFVAAVLIQKESGGNLAEVLEKVADTTRERFRLKKQVMVHTAQGRMTGWILSILPAGLGAAMYFMDPDAMSVLWKNPVGLKMLYGAITMDMIGALIIRKIVSIRV
jgi:tight adherence protein B